MQADRFTVKPQEALAAAQRLAGARHNPEVTPQHLLVALLEQDGGIVVPVLRRAGADPGRVRRRVNEALDSQPTVTGEASAPALGQDLIRLLQAADDEASGLGDEYVSTEHLLLALAAEPAIDAGASREQLVEAVEQVRGPHRVTDQNPEDRFQPVYVDEPSVEDTIAILRGLKERYEVHHGVRIQDSGIIAAATLSQRYIADRFLPDKAIDLIDEP